MGQVAEVVREALYQDIDPWESFAMTMRHLSKIAYEDRAFARVTARIGAGGELGEAKHRLDALLGKLVERAQDARKMRADVDAEDLPPLFLGVVLGTPHNISSARLERYVEIILDGLRFQADREPMGG